MVSFLKICSQSTFYFIFNLGFLKTFVKTYENKNAVFEKDPLLLKGK